MLRYEKRHNIRVIQDTMGFKNMCTFLHGPKIYHGL